MANVKFCFVLKICYNETNFVKGAQMRARAIDYSVYSEESLFMELDNTKVQLAKLESEKESLLDRKSQIEQALHSIPTDETADDLKNAYSIGIFNSHEEFEKMLDSEDEEQ